MTRNLYRVNLGFTDGDFKVDVWAADPSIAMQLALQDARMLSTNRMFTGALMGRSVEPLCEMRTDAHCVDDEFEAMILATYDVKITDRAGAPWDWGFTGTRASLENMWAEHWGDSPERVPEIKGIVE